MPVKPSCCHVAILANAFPPCLWWQIPTRRKPTSFWMATSSLSAQAFTLSEVPFQWRPAESKTCLSLNITKCDVDILKELFDNVVMHCHDPRDRRTRDEGVDCVGTTDDALRVCLDQRFPWQSSLASPDGVTGGTSLRIESRALCKTRCPPPGTEKLSTRPENSVPWRSRREPDQARRASVSPRSANRLKHVGYHLVSGDLFYHGLWVGL